MRIALTSLIALLIVWVCGGRYFTLLLDGIHTMPVGPVPGKPQVTVERSVVSWPTPFHFNFMTGRSPSWKRYLYYRTEWRQPDGRLRTRTQRFEQWFYPNQGWSSAMTGS
jgi:hypothetical protein